jgi:hypothetical protein
VLGFNVGHWGKRMKVDLALCGFCDDGEKGAELLIVGAQ